jgi:catechol 2,3-dioxygenase
VGGRAGAGAVLGAHDDDRALVELRERRGAKPRPPRSRTGLYHFAILLPDRPSLGRFLLHLVRLDARAGSADHLVSESLYLQDPDGLGIEVYADRPREMWRRVGRELMMATDPIDGDGLVEAAGSTAWSGMPRGTVMGHLHLHVGDIAAASAFYSEALGLDRMVWQYPGALFLAAGGYHHTLGTNVWAGPGATPSRPDEAQLLAWTVVLPDESAVSAAAASVSAAGHAVVREGADALLRDPWETPLRLRAARP